MLRNRKLMYSKIVKCKDVDLLHFVELEQPKGFNFEGAQILDDLLTDELEFVGQMLYNAFHRTTILSDMQIIIEICKKIGIDTNENFMEQDFEEMKKQLL